jgi:hypothetical protein
MGFYAKHVLPRLIDLAMRSKDTMQDFRVELSDVTVVEVTIVPNVSGGAARASLKSFRLS